MSDEKIEQEFEFRILEDMSDIPDAVKAKFKKGDMFLRATSLTTDFLPEKWLNELSDDSNNNRLIWRHRDPELGGRYYGRNVFNQVIDGSGKNEGKKVIDSIYRVFGGQEGTPSDKLQKYIKLKNEHGHPVGISKGFILNKCPKNGEILRVFALEDSITYIPKCKTCLTTEVYKMENKNKIDEKEIKKLQDELNSAKLQLEEKDVEFDDMKTKIEKFESDVESKEAEKKTLEDKLVAVSDSLKKLEAKLVDQERAPYIAKLKATEKSKLVFEIMKDRPIPEIEKRILENEVEQAGAQVVTTTIDEEKAKNEEGEKPESIGVSALRNNPTLARDVAEVSKNDAELKLQGVWY